MTKAKTTKKTVKTETAKTTEMFRKGFRAYVGVYGAAYEAAVPAFEKASKNYDDYAIKGEALQTVAATFAKDANKNVRAFAIKRFEKRSAQFRSFLPSAANDRVEELETQITKLNKKIVTLSKKAPKRVTKVATKVVETVKVA